MRQLIQRGWQRPGWINYLLLPLSWLYRLVMSLRSVAYRQGLLRSHRLPVPVIVVGNITVGGSGKSPLVRQDIKAPEPRAVRGASAMKHRGKA